MWELQSDWYSPTRLRNNPTIQYDFPGDRFIPNRSLMDLDQAHTLLTSTTKKLFNPNFNEVYRQKLEEKLTLDSEGRPFKMLVFRGSPKSSRRSVRLIDEMKREEVETLDISPKQYQFRKLPKERIGFKMQLHALACNEGEATNSRSAFGNGSFTYCKDHPAHHFGISWRQPLILTVPTLRRSGYFHEAIRQCGLSSKNVDALEEASFVWLRSLRQRSGGIIRQIKQTGFGLMTPFCQSARIVDIVISYGIMRKDEWSFPTTPTETLLPYAICCVLIQIQREARILDAPNIKNDYYLNIMDWGRNNILAVALGSELYLWNSENNNVQKLLQVGANDYPTSVAWSGDAKTVAVGYINSKLQLWDAETSKLVRSLEGHNGRVAATGWNDHILTSGSEDKSIINHDVRAPNNLISRIQVHAEEVCGLKWSSGGNILASGGNENLIYIWDASKMSSSNFLYRFNDHSAAVKALAWCPYQSDICGLEWNRHQKEILSGHGFGIGDHQDQLCLWRYPSMTKVGDFRRHTSRVLHICQSPDGLTVASAGADETLRFWEVFGPPTVDNSRISDLDSFLSLKTSPLR
ncbi:cell division cycle 20.5, cofactor of apc complex [Fagus crenata]